MGRYVDLLKKHIWNNQSGMTMVEVMLAFAVLSVIMASLSGIMAFSSRMFRQSVDLKRTGENFQSVIYKSEPSDKEKVIANSFVLTDSAGEKINVDAQYCILDSADILTQEEKDVLDVEVYYFKTKNNKTE